jgi:hypothetical protein
MLWNLWFFSFYYYWHILFWFCFLCNRVKADSGEPIVTLDISVKLFLTEQKSYGRKNRVFFHWQLRQKELHAKRNTDVWHFSFKIDHQENNFTDLWLFAINFSCLINKIWAAVYNFDIFEIFLLILKFLNL